MSAQDEDDHVRQMFRAFDMQRMSQDAVVFSNYQPLSSTCHHCLTFGILFIHNCYNTITLLHRQSHLLLLLVISRLFSCPVGRAKLHYSVHCKWRHGKHLSVDMCELGTISIGNHWTICLSHFMELDVQIPSA